VVYVLDGERSRPGGPQKKSSGVDYHAGENETSNTMVSHPGLVHLDRAATESGADQKRVELPEFLYTGIWWYARFPNHYSGDGSVATKELGEWNMTGWISTIVEAIHTVKADDASLKMQNEFYEKSKHPLDTRP
jgi:creatinine amidohydrolase